MPVDLNTLPIESGEVVDVDFDSYADPQEFPPPLPDGIYTFKPSKVEFDFKPAQNGHAGVLTAILAHEVFDGNGNRLGSLNFDRVSDKVFDRQGVKVSMFYDQLRAWGDRQRYGSPKEKAQAIQAHVDSGDVFSAQTSREVYCGHKDTPHEMKKSADGTVISGDAAFNMKGNKIPPDTSEMECPICHKQARVNSRIQRRIPKA